MGDNYTGLTCSSLTPVCNDVGSLRRFLLEYVPLYSLLDGIYVHFVNVSSYMSHQFTCFIDDLAVREERCREYFPQSFLYSFSSGECSSRVLYTESNNAVFGRSMISCHGNPSTSNSSEITGSKVNTVSCFENFTTGYGSNTSLIVRGLLLPFHGFILGWKLTSLSVKELLIYMRNSQIELQSFISRLKRTLQGSAEDIGWLETTPGMPPVENGTPRFTELLQCIRNGEHSLPNCYVYLLVPGLFSNLSPLYFVNTKKFFSKMGLTCHIAKIHSEASVEKNSWELKQYIEELYWGSGKHVLILGHSKGGVDAAAALSLYWSDLKDKVAGLALVQSPYGGTPIASDLLREGQVAYSEAWKIMEFVVCKLIKGDMRALVDLTYEKRRDFITKHRLPSDEVPLVSFHTEAAITPGVLATMSHIAHAELPWLPLPRFISEAEAEAESSLKVPILFPLSAAMALGALHLRLRYGETSDGLVTRRDAEVPGSVVVRPDRKLDHAWMVYSIREDVSQANASEMCEALLTLLVEIAKEQGQHGGCYSCVDLIP